MSNHPVLALLTGRPVCNSLTDRDPFSVAIVHHLGMCAEATMARPYNAWVSDPNAHRHFGNRFIDHTGAPSILSTSEGMMPGPPGTDRLPSHPHHFQSVGAIPVYHSAYGPAPLLPPSASVPLPPPQYRGAPPFTNPPAQPFPEPGRVLPGSAHNPANIETYSDLRMTKPSHGPVSLHRRLPSLTEQHPQPRNEPGLEYQDVGNHTLQPSTTVGQRPVNPLPVPSAARRSSQTHMPNLIGESRMEALKDIKFRLKLRQQPKAARSCGFGERDRRVIDPPPIVELIIESPTLTEDEIRRYRCYESYVMSCSIWDESGNRDASYMPEEYRHQRRLMGSLVGTPFVGKDEHGKEGCFFTFADLSCRTPGSFRLKFSVIMIDPTRAGIIRHFPILTEVQSDVFTVYNAKDFPGMVASTQLAHSLKAQGCILQLKKGNDKAKGPKDIQDLSDDDLDDIDDDAEMAQGKRKRRLTRQ